MSSFGLQVNTSLVAISPTVRSPGKRFRVPKAMQMSRSVTTPISFLFASTSGSIPQLRFHMYSTVAPTLVSGPQVTTEGVMMSLTFIFFLLRFLPAISLLGVKHELPFMKAKLVSFFTVNQHRSITLHRSCPTRRGYDSENRGD